MTLTTPTLPVPAPTLPLTRPLNLGAGSNRPDDTASLPTPRSRSRRAPPAVPKPTSPLPTAPTSPAPAQPTGQVAGTSFAGNAVGSFGGNSRDGCVGSRGFDNLRRFGRKLGSPGSSTPDRVRPTCRGRSTVSVPVTLARNTWSEEAPHSPGVPPRTKGSRRVHGRLSRSGLPENRLSLGQLAIVGGPASASTRPHGPITRLEPGRDKIRGVGLSPEQRNGGEELSRAVGLGAHCGWNGVCAARECLLLVNE